MGHKNRNSKHQTPKDPLDLLNPATENSESESEVKPEAEATPEPKAEAATPEPKAEAETMDELLAKALDSIQDPELKAKAIEQIQKLKQQAEKNEANKAFAAFDKEMKEFLGGSEDSKGYLAQLAEKHGVDLSNRRIVITFPEGKFDYSNGVKGKGGGNGSRTGFPNSWKTELVKPNGNTMEFKSAASAADHLGDIEKPYTGRPTMAVVLAESPQVEKVETLTEERIYRVHLKK